VQNELNAVVGDAVRFAGEGPTVQPLMIFNRGTSALRRVTASAFLYTGKTSVVQKKRYA